MRFNLFSGLVACAIAMLSPTSQAFQYNISAQKKSGECILSINNKAYQTVPKNVDLVWIHEEGQQTTVLGASCQALTSTSPVLSPLKAPVVHLHPVSKRQSSEGVSSDVFMHLWLGPEIKTANSFQQISTTITAPPPPQFPDLKNGGASQWLGLQPTDQAARQYFVLQPVLGWSEDTKSAVNQLFNMYCAPNGCPSGPFVDTKAGDSIFMLLKYFPKNERFPALWQASWKVGRTGDVQKLVIPDNTIIRTLANPTFCQGDRCRLPVALLAQEYVIAKPAPIQDLFKLFFPTQKIQFSKVQYQTAGKEPVKWRSFADNLHYRYKGQYIGDLKALKAFVAKLKADPKRQQDYQYNNCLYHLLLQVNYQRSNSGDGFEVSIRQPQTNPPQCQAKFYKS